MTLVNALGAFSLKIAYPIQCYFAYFGNPNMDELGTSQHNVALNLRGLQLTPAAPGAWRSGCSDLVLKHQLRTSNQATDCVPMCRRWNPAGRTGRTMLNYFRFVSNFSVLSDKYKYLLRLSRKEMKPSPAAQRAAVQA
jgi:hypothetical protein